MYHTNIRKNSMNNGFFKLKKGFNRIMISVVFGDNNAHLHKRKFLSYKKNRKFKLHKIYSIAIILLFIRLFYYIFDYYSMSNVYQIFSSTSSIVNLLYLYSISHLLLPFCNPHGALLS